jgi:hypothetical protein
MAETNGEFLLLRCRLGEHFLAHEVAVGCGHLPDERSFVLEAGRGFEEARNFLLSTQPAPSAAAALGSDGEPDPVIRASL